MKKENYERQLVIANSLYELGMNQDLIKTITTISSSDLDNYRKSLKNKTNFIDKKTNEDIYFLKIPHAGALMSSIQNAVTSACEKLNKLDRLHILDVEDSYSKTYTQFLEWFKSHKTGCYIAPRDSISCGVLNAANESGVNVPGDVEILSVIGTKYSTIARPSLTSLDIDMYEVGSIAMRMLTKLLAGNLKVKVFPFESSIHHRASTKFE